MLWQCGGSHSCDSSCTGSKIPESGAIPIQCVRGGLSLIQFFNKSSAENGVECHV